jgi:alpha-D-ribose 1-methylphosphonate 5-triphosphate synthase subunit PhnG
MNDRSTDTVGAEAAARTLLMKICVAATEAELRAGLAGLGDIGTVETLRAPETGLVMLRGRMGGVGAPFNVGEAPVTRASVRLRSGEIGHAYLMGQQPEKARLAALADAAGQRLDYRHVLEHTLVEPVAQRVAAQDQRVAEETEATRVNFFTLARGEDTV